MGAVVTDLGRRQEELVRALVAGGEMPDGFDSVSVCAAASALLLKRAHAAAQCLPVEASLLDRRFFALFTGWAHTRPKTTTSDDARLFREHLYATGELVRPEGTRHRWPFSDRTRRTPRNE